MLRTTLTTVITQADLKGLPSSSLEISVEYDIQDNTVERVHEVRCTNHKLNVSTDMTCIFLEHLEDELNQYIDKTDWKELYHHHKNNSNIL